MSNVINIYQPPIEADKDAFEINTGQSDYSWGKAASGHDCIRYGGLATLNPETVSAASAIYFDQGTMFHQLMAHYLVWRDMNAKNPVYVDGIRHTDRTLFLHPYHVCLLWKDKFDWWADIWRLFCEYVKYYEVRDEIYQTLFIETVFEIDIPTSEESYRVFYEEKNGLRNLATEPVKLYKASKRVDWTARDRVTRKIVHVDHKTCSDLGESTLKYPFLDGGFHLTNALGLKYFGDNYAYSIANMARKFVGRNKHPAFDRVNVDLLNVNPWAQSYVYALRERGRMAKANVNVMNWPGVYTANGGGKSPCNDCPFGQLCIENSRKT